MLTQFHGIKSKTKRGVPSMNKIANQNNKKNEIHFPRVEN